MLSISSRPFRILYILVCEKEEESLLFQLKAGSPSFSYRSLQGGKIFPFGLYLIPLDLGTMIHTKELEMEKRAVYE
jgi:hypothetical protein